MKTNYVIASWSGPRRSGEDGLEVLEKQIEQLCLLRHHLSQVTVVVPFNPNEPPAFSSYLDGLAKSELPVVVLRRPENIGVSYGCWSYAYDVYGKAFDHYIFMEDDYYFVEDDFDTKLVEMCVGYGLLCGYVSRSEGREWPGNSNGIATVEALEAVKARYGRLPYDSDASAGSYTEESGQVGWGLAFQACGYKIGDITRKYACLHWYWQRGACELIPDQPVNDRFLFVPFQAPLNYPFLAFKGRHEGAEGILYGTGPTLKNYDYAEDDGSRIRVGLNSFIAEKRKLDYYFFGHKDARSQAYMHEVQAYSGVKFGFTHMDGESDGDWLSCRKALSLGALPFHVTRRLEFRDDIARNPMVDHAINFSALQFMVYAGIKKIYLVGCDATSVISHKDPGIDEVRRIDVLMGVWCEFAKFVNGKSEIVSVNPVSLKELFKARYTV